MITIEQLIDKIDDAFYKENDYYLSETAPETFAEIVAIEFAKLHVEAALTAASENADADYTVIALDENEPNIGDSIEIYVITSSILNAYPLDNIK
mgnify:CR=1 FL=1